MKPEAVQKITAGLIRLYQWIETVFNNYFELILAVAVFLLLGGTVVLVLTYFRTRPPKFFRKALDAFLLGGFLGGIFLLVALLGHDYIVNGRRPYVVLDSTYPLVAETSWVEEDLEIFYVRGKELITIGANGSGQRTVFSASDFIRDYHFSPDGKFLLVASERQLYLLPRPNGEARLIEELPAASSPESKPVKGAIDRVRWSPDSKKFCYHLAKWTDVGSADLWYVYSLAGQEKRAIHSPGLAMTDLEWDLAGENLYCLWFEAQDTSVHANPYMVKVYAISMTTLNATLTLRFPFDKARLPSENLAVRGIELFTASEQLSFSRGEKNLYSWKAPAGPRLGLDAEDWMYFVKNRWWKRRLFVIPRVPARGDFVRYPYDGGQLVVRSLRWLPAGRYVIMEHDDFGTLILEPATGRIGILTSDQGDRFGWYAKLVNVGRGK